jgi:outer membrane protein OmpA-like peptidoglycan-associated protein
MRSSARRVDRTSRVRLARLGASPAPAEDSGFPALRGLPAWPRDPETGLALDPDKLSPGATWTAEGERALDFDGSGSFVLLPFLAQYRFKGRVDYRGERAIGVSAKFATRWRPDGRRPLGRAAGEGGARLRPVSDLVSNASGTHDLEIVLDAESFAPLFMRDRFDESFSLASGGSERRSGFTLYFFEGAGPADPGADALAIAKAVAGREPGAVPAPSSPAPASPPAPVGTAAPVAPSAPAAPALPAASPRDGEAPPAAMEKAGLEIDKSPEGLVLRIKELRFVADSDAILPSEFWRLDAIADALKALPGRTFMVAGHSAGVGKALGELDLSERRAKKVADELGSRGIESQRLLYRGYGSSKPLEPNDSEAGRAKNRRVEIIVLD